MTGYTAFTSLYPRVLLETPGCPKPLALLHIRDAARDFFLVSQAWQYDLPAISIVAAQTEYDISPPLEGTEICAVVKLERNESLMTPGRSYQLDDTMGRIILQSEPDDAEADALVATVALRPSPSGTEIPDRLLSDWAEAIAAGAKASLCAMPNKAWTDYELSAYYRGEYQKGLRRASWDVKRQRTMRAVSIKPPFFA